MKKMGNYIWCLCVMLLLWGIQVKASEAELIGANILLEVTESACIYEETSEQSNVVATIEAGTPIISTAVQDGVWIEVTYQQVKGFIEVKSVKVFGQDGLEDEFEQIEQANRLLITELRYVEKQATEKIIWGVVIAVLVVAIFTVGIVSGVLKNKKPKRTKTVYKHQKH